MVTLLLHLVILCRGLYKLTMYGKCVEDSTCAVMDLQAILNAKLWHAHFGHLNFASLLRLCRNLKWCLLCLSLRHLLNMYVRAAYWVKCSVLPFPKMDQLELNAGLQLIHNDVCGPMQSPSFGNYLYFMTFIDDYSRYAWVYPLKAKSKVFFVLQSIFGYG